MSGGQLRRGVVDRRGGIRRGERGLGEWGGDKVEGGEKRRDKGKMTRGEGKKWKEKEKEGGVRNFC